MKKNLGLLFISILLSLLMIEALLRATTDRWIKNFNIYNPSYYLLADDQLKLMTAIFDAETGWDHKADTPFGERPISKVYGNPLMISFGDSYVYGDEVADSETWQSYMADIYKRDIYNFGMRGYGTDQAFLRYKKLKSQSEQFNKVPIALLGLTTENINRVVNVYRKFYFVETGVPLTKPRAILNNGKLEFAPNPIQSPEDVAKLKDPEFIRMLSEKDGLFRGHESSFSLRKPYVLNLAYPLFWKTLRSPPNGELSFAYNFWKNQEYYQLMTSLLVSFSEDVRLLGNFPVIVLMPTPPDVENFFKNPGDGLIALKNICKEKQLNCFNGVELFARKKPEESKLLWGPNGHMSPYGNRVFARGLSDFLKESGFIKK